jgi:ribosomal protein S18 acetylase RimI-like enzyme
MFGWLRRFTHPLGQIDPYLAKSRVRPAKIRVWNPADFDACMELYRLNEPGRFPLGGLPSFEAALKDGLMLYLVLEMEGRLVGCGGVGIYRYGAVEQASLYFGLIHPQWQRRGLGSTLMLARLAMLPPHAWQVAMTVVPSSRSFYEYYGFLFHSRVKIEPEGECDALSAYLSPDDREMCRTLLERIGAELPSGEPEVPIRKVPTPE